LKITCVTYLISDFSFKMPSSDSERESRTKDDGAKSPKKSEKKGKGPLPSLFGHLGRTAAPDSPSSSVKRKKGAASADVSPRKKTRPSKRPEPLYAPASPRRSTGAGKHAKERGWRGMDALEKKRLEDERKKLRARDDSSSETEEDDDETKRRKAEKVARAEERAKKKGKITPSKASLALSDFSDDSVADKTYIAGKSDASDDDDDDDGEDDDDAEEEDDVGGRPITRTTDHKAKDKSSAAEKSEPKKRRGSVSRKRSSPVWNYFRPCEKNPEKYVVCIVVDQHTKLQCGARIKRTDQSTTGLLKHLRQHKQAYADVLNTKAQQVVGDATDTSLVITSQKNLASAEDKAREILGKSPQVRRMPKTKTLESYFEKQPSLVKYPPQSESQKRIDLATMTYMARCNLPMSHADHPGFKE